MPTYRSKPIAIEAKPYQLGMEDRIMYHIPMFGDFTVKECLDAGFLNSSKEVEEHKMKHAEIKTKRGWRTVTTNDMVVVYPDSRRDVLSKEDFNELYVIAE